MSELTLTTQMSCAHFYHQEKWDQQKNQETFGKCFTEYGHGHDYKVEVIFESPKKIEALFPSMNSASGLIQNLKDKIAVIRDRLDHQHLNFVIPDFKKTIPTTENLAVYFLKELSATNPELKIKKLRVFETPELFVEINN